MDKLKAGDDRRKRDGKIGLKEGKEKHKKGEGVRKNGGKNCMFSEQ